MRAFILAAAALAGCTPDITSGSYLCGPQELCPEGLACNPADDTCVHPSLAEAFTCDSAAVPQTFAIPDLQCAGTYMGKGCLPAGDSQNSMTFSLASTCGAKTVHVSVAFPEAFEPIGLALQDAGGAQLATDTSCSSGFVGAGEDQRCIVQSVPASGDYTIQVQVGDATKTCGGACNFNRYNVTVQLAAQ